MKWSIRHRRGLEAKKEKRVRKKKRKEIFI